jgi:hypothetical protein
VQVEYRVAGTDEGGSLRLVEGPAEEPGFSETELETTERGVVELFLNNLRVARRSNDGSRCGASAVPASAAAGGSGEAAGSWSAPSLDWTGAVGAAVDVFRNGVRIGNCSL